MPTSLSGDHIISTVRIVMTVAVLFSSPAIVPADDAAGGSEPVSVKRPPAGFDAHYTKCLFVGEFPILSSAKVHDAALEEAAYIVRNMLRNRPDVLQALGGARTRLVVMAFDEFTTDIPEHRDLRPKDYWDRRARGLGATTERPAVSCGEENLLQFPGDPYAAENILIHEFAHAVHEMALNRLNARFDSTLIETYKAALDAELWQGTYAATNHREYWAEGVQSYFGTNREDDRDHNHVNTRAELREYDPRLFALIDGVFLENPWQYRVPQERSESGRRHLGEYEFQDSPEFVWPERLRTTDINSRNE